MRVDRQMPDEATMDEVVQAHHEDRPECPNVVGAFQFFTHEGVEAVGSSIGCATCGWVAQ